MQDVDTDISIARASLGYLSHRVGPGVHLPSDLLRRGVCPLNHQARGTAAGAGIPMGVSHSCVSLYQDELMAELEELEQEELDKNLLEISGPETVPLPNVPSIALPSKPSEYFLSRVRHPPPLGAGAFVVSYSGLRTR